MADPRIWITTELLFRSNSGVSAIARLNRYFVSSVDTGEEAPLGSTNMAPITYRAIGAGRAFALPIDGPVAGITI
jgi:hypothetical protein